MTTETQNNTQVPAADSEVKTESVVVTPPEGSNTKPDANPVITEKAPEAPDANKQEEPKVETKPEESDKDSKTEETPDYSKLSFKNPDQVDQEMLKEATEIFGETKLSPEIAQKLVALQEKAAEKFQASTIQQWEKTRSDWVESSKKDPEIGGLKFDENKGLANRAFKNYGTPELGKLLEDYGFGDHPEVVRMFAKVGATLKEDANATVGIGNKPSTDGKTIAERMYPSHNSNGQF